MNTYGSIDLTALGNIVRSHPELVRTKQLKDGTTHQYININVNEKPMADQWGNVAYIKVACKADQRKEGVNYYISDLKHSQKQEAAQQTPAHQQAPAAQQLPPSQPQADLPF